MKFLLVIVLIVWAPSIAFGEELIAHELTHVVQQKVQPEPKSATASKITLQTVKTRNALKCSAKNKTRVAISLSGKLSAETLKAFKSKKLKTLVLRDGKTKVVFNVTKFETYRKKSKRGPTLTLSFSGCRTK